MNGFDFFTQAVKGKEPEPPKPSPAHVVITNRKARPASAVEPSLAEVSFLAKDKEVT